MSISRPKLLFRVDSYYDKIDLVQSFRKKAFKKEWSFDEVESVLCECYGKSLDEMKYVINKYCR